MERKMTMDYSTKLSTKVEKLSKNEIAKGCLARKNWDKKWEVFHYNGLSISARLCSISISYDTVTMILSGTYKPSDGDEERRPLGDNASLSSWAFDFPLRRKDYTQRMFSESLFSACQCLVRYSYAKDAIQATHEYKRLEAIDKKSVSSTDELAKKYCEDHDIEWEEDYGSVSHGISEKLHDQNDTHHANAFLIKHDDEPFAEELYALACWLKLEDRQSQCQDIIKSGNWETDVDEDAKNDPDPEPAAELKPATAS